VLISTVACCTARNLQQYKQVSRAAMHIGDLSYGVLKITDRCYVLLFTVAKFSALFLQE